ncbi:MAG TPA: Gldg family protein, partial [Longimicrobiales bacterium]|nr:Gldg family protein [Longimicrobiales bacterium]
DEEAASEAQSLGIRPIQFNVLRGDEFQARRGWFGLAILYADEREVIPVIERTDDLEYRLASAVATMTREDQPVLAVLTGFGARDLSQMPSLRESLSQRYRLRTVSLEGDSVPALGADSIDVAVLAGPSRPLPEGAVGRIRDYVAGGGPALFLLDRNQIDPRAPVSRSIATGLEGFLEERGVGAPEGMVYDLQANERVSLGQQGMFQLVQAYPLWPITFPAGEHSTTRDLDNLTLAWAGPLEIRDSTGVVPLWETTEAAGVRSPGSPIMPDAQAFENPNPDSLAIRTVAVAVDPAATAGQEASDAPGDDGSKGATAPAPSAPAPSEGRLVVVGDADFLSGQFVRSNPQNGVFAANAVDWLAQDEALIRIRSKDRTPPALVFESDMERGVLKWGNLVGVPLLFALVGLVRVTGRRRRAEREWEEMRS